MNKVLFILNYRSGTNLWQFMSGKKDVPFSPSEKTRKIKNGKVLVNTNVKEGFVNTAGWTGSKSSFFLATSPSNVCPIEPALIPEGYIENVLDRNPPFDYFAWHTHMGDWWGDLPSFAIPEPYELETPVRYGPDELNNLPGKNWSFVHLLRDGRNQIESLRNIEGGIEQKKNKDNQIDYFKVLCKGYRNRSRMAINCINRVNNFKIFKFENFIKNPVETLCEMFVYVGLKPNKGFFQEAYNITIKQNVVKQHSSFSSKKNLNRRWISWSPQEKDIFKNICGKELIELGYEKNYDW